MHEIDKPTTLVGIAELRTQVPRLLRQMTTREVILTRRNRPCAVLFDYERYRRWEELLDRLDEFLVAGEVKRRAKTHRKKWTTQEEMNQLIGLMQRYRSAKG